jgi:mRNA deadenylase 3'-5' endonuclease subunit Ccr4
MDHPVFDMDGLGVLPKASALSHRLPFASAYSTGRGEEPTYTNYTGHFVGTLDYVFYTKNQLATLSYLEVDEERLLQKHTAIPSLQYSSDHIALVTEMDWLQ